MADGFIDAGEAVTLYAPSCENALLADSLDTIPVPNEESMVVDAPAFVDAPPSDSMDTATLKESAVCDATVLCGPLDQHHCLPPATAQFELGLENAFATHSTEQNVSRSDY